MLKQVSYDESFFDSGRQYFAKGLPAWKKFVLDTLKAESIADFGAGQGDWLEPFQGIIPIWACDGYADVNHLRIDVSNFRKVDIGSMNVLSLDVGPRDVCMSLEAMEHVANVNEGNFLDCMLLPNPRYVVFGVASGRGVYDPTQFKVNRLGEKIPGGPGWKMQWGRHHVNCQPVDVVIEKMKARGYVVDQDLSDQFCNLRTEKTSTKRSSYAFAPFYRKNTRVYKKS